MQGTKRKIYLKNPADMVWFGWSGLVLLLSFYSTLLHAEELYALTLTAVAVISLGATGTYLKGL
jgi:hypothetical protein